MSTKIVITGDKAIAAKLRRLGDPKLAKRIVTMAIKNALKPVAAAARNNVPTDKGNFAKLIKVRTRRSRKGVMLIVGFAAKDISKLNAARAKRAEKTGKPAKAAIDTGGFYPIAVEFGTKTQAPQAPMRRAFDSTAGTASISAATEIRDEVLSEAKG